MPEGAALCYRWWQGPADDHYCELPAGHDGVCACACGEQVEFVDAIQHHATRHNGGS